MYKQTMEFRVYCQYVGILEPVISLDTESNSQWTIGFIWQHT